MGKFFFVLTPLFTGGPKFSLSYLIMRYWYGSRIDYGTVKDRYIYQYLLTYIDYTDLQIYITWHFESWSLLVRIYQGIDEFVTKIL